MNKKIKSIISKFIPLSIKKSFFFLWQESDERFRLYSKIVLNENGDLFQHRFLWSDLILPINSIRNRFGKNQQIFVLTDRADFPVNNELRLVSIEDVEKFESNVSHAVICAFESDEKLLQILRVLRHRPNIYYYCPFRYLPTARYLHRNDTAKSVLQAELELQRGKFDLADFENIIQAIEITRNIAGDYVEIGVYKGDSAHAALHYMKRSQIKRRSYFYDLFEGFTNVSSQKSGDATWLNSHSDTSLQFVEKFLEEFENFTVGKLDIINHELPSTIREIALCNLDVDMYEATKAGLSKVAPLMTKGGIIILEDPGHTPFLAGALLASTEFLEIEGKNFTSVQMASGQMFLIKS